MIYDLLVIGGGVSGISAAITYKRLHKLNSVLILESLDSPLKKLNASGAGKGNFTNENLSSSVFDNSSFVKEVFKDNPKGEILSFFDFLNIKYTKDDEGRYYPFSLDAKTISSRLIEELNKLNIELITNHKVKSISKDEYFNVDDYKAKSLVISVGGINYKSLGSDGALYGEIEKAFNHTFTRLIPSNIYININETNITKRLTGLRFKAKLSLYYNNKYIYSEKGELLFKDNALSGIVSFNVSNYLSRYYKSSISSPFYVYVDFTNDTDILDTVKSKDELYGIFTRKLVDTIYDDNKSLKENLSMFKAYKFSVKGLFDADNAQATTGGINLSEINATLESKLVDNLFFTGDILDVSAISGGFNLSFAFISGLRAGQNIK